MFPIRMFCNGLFAPRMFPKVGADPIFNPIWAIDTNAMVGHPRSQAK